MQNLFVKLLEALSKKVFSLFLTFRKQLLFPKKSLFLHNSFVEEPIFLKEPLKNHKRRKLIAEGGKVPHLRGFIECSVLLFFFYRDWVGVHCTHRLVKDRKEDFVLSSPAFVHLFFSSSIEKAWAQELVEPVTCSL